MLFILCMYVKESEMQLLSDGRPNIEKHVKYIFVMYADDMILSQKRHRVTKTAEVFGKLGFNDI